MLTAVALATTFAHVRGGAAEAPPLRPNQIPGYDISWPQCGKPYPTPPVAFAIIGINGGRPYTANPCFEDEYRWARQFEPHPAVYLNTAFPKPEHREGDNGPFGPCEPTDDWCRAYNYGYGFVREAVQRATALRITPSTWWLDVETNNFWSLDPEYNVQALRGALYYISEHHLPAGIYSTSRQWRIIAGTFAPGLPIWIAGAQGIEGAAARCFDPSFFFAGGTPRLIQYYDYGFDTNFLCPYGTVGPESIGSSTPPAPAPTPRSPIPGGHPAAYRGYRSFLAMVTGG
jgi:hypothetical protein